MCVPPKWTGPICLNGSEEAAISYLLWISKPNNLSFNSDTVIWFAGTTYGSSIDEKALEIKIWEGAAKQKNKKDVLNREGWGSEKN